MLAAFTPAMAAAADWSVESAAQVYALVESNPQLSVGEKHGSQAGVADVSLDLQRRTQLLDLSLNTRASAHRYGGDAGLDREDQRLVLTLSHRGETYSLGGSASYTRDTTLTSELGTTGNTGFNQRHRARGLSLAPSWQLTERLTTSASMGWQDSTYAGGGSNGLSGYSYKFAGFSAGFDVSELATASLQVKAGRLDSALYAFSTDNIGIRLQLDRTWSPRWSTSIAGGPSRVRMEGRESGGSLFSASVTRQSQRLALSLSLGRDNAPNGSGLLSRRDDVSLNANLALREHVSATAGFSMIRSTDLLPEAGFTISDVRYSRVDVSLSWSFARDWSLAVGAGRSEQKMLGGAPGRNMDGRMVLAWRRHSPVS
jgi:hypothetical protein